MSTRFITACAAATSAAAAIAFAGGAPARGSLPSGARPATQALPPTARAAGSGESCVDGNPLDWFGPAQQLNSCPGFGQLPLQGDLYTPTTHADLDGDGAQEYFSRPSANEDLGIISEGVDQSGFVLYGNDAAMSGGQLVQTRHGLVPCEALASLVRSAFFDVRGAGLVSGGFRDLDRDGDLDLVMQLWVLLWDDSYAGMDVWFENTGMQASMHRRADLNGDGRVTGADLGLLVGEWGP